MKFAMWMSCLGLALAMVACQSGPQPATRLPEGDIGVEEAFNVVVLEPELESDLTVISDRATRVGDGRLRVQIKVANTSGETLKIQLQSVFKDDEGFATEKESIWEHQILSEGNSLDYQCTSLNDKATRYVVRIRKAEE